MQEGWRLLKDMSDYPRDYLILFPSSSGHGCTRRELSYDTASAMQNRVLRMVRLGDVPLFCPSSTRFSDAALQQDFHVQCNRLPGVSRSLSETSCESLVSTSQRAICQESQPKESGSCSAQLSHNCRKDCLIHWQKPRRGISSDELLLRTRIAGGGTESLWQVARTRCANCSAKSTRRTHTPRRRASCFRATDNRRSSTRGGSRTQGSTG